MVDQQLESTSGDGFLRKDAKTGPIDWHEDVYGAYGAAHKNPQRVVPPPLPATIDAAERLMRKGVEMEHVVHVLHLEFESRGIMFADSGRGWAWQTTDGFRPDRTLYETLHELLPVLFKNAKPADEM